MLKATEYPGVDAIIESLALTSKDRVLVLTDTAVDEQPIQIIKKCLNQHCATVEIRLLPNELQDDIPDDIYAGFNDIDVIFLAASQSWYQAPSRQAAKHRLGKRVVECYNMKADMFNNGALCVDPGKLIVLTKQFEKAFEAGDHVHIQTKIGTDFTARYHRVYKEDGCYTRPGSGGNLPAGEISLGIVPLTATGYLVFDVSFDGLDINDNGSLKMAVEKGRISDIEYGNMDRIRELQIKHTDFTNIAEIGIGTNRDAILGRTVLEDEKKLGTIHIGFGNDTYFGGSVTGPHFDGVMDKATIIIDGQPFMVDGRLLNLPEL